MSNYKDDDVRALERMASAIRGQENALKRQVAYLREQGAPWSVIGNAIGTTRQAAYLRFGKPKRSGDVVAE